MPPPADNCPEKIRQELRRLSLVRRTRRAEFSSAMPSDWRPLQTIDPRTGQVFTEDGAWEFVAEKLDDGTPVTPIELSKPPGKTGYVIQVSGGVGRPTIYIKLQLGSGFVFGRSFHYSEYK